MVYNYVPKQGGISQSISINILKRPKLSKETRDIYKGIAEGMGALKIFDEWNNKKDDEYGFEAAGDDYVENKTEYMLSDVINKGTFQITMKGIADGEVGKGDMKNIVSDFRKVALRLSQEGSFKNTPRNKENSQYNQNANTREIRNLNTVERTDMRKGPSLGSLVDEQSHGATSNNSVKCSLDDDGEGIQGVELEAYDEYGLCELDRNVEEMKFYRTLAGEEHEYVCEVEYDDSNPDKGEVDSGKGQCSYDSKNQVMETSYKGVECIVDYKKGVLQYSSPRMNCDINYATGDVNQEMLK